LSEEKLRKVPRERKRYVPALKVWGIDIDWGGQETRRKEWNK
jgi:hypothetical protein